MFDTLFSRVLTNASKEEQRTKHTKQGTAMPAGSESTSVHITSHCQHNLAWPVVFQSLHFQDRVTDKNCAATNTLQTPMHVHICVYLCKINGCLVGQSWRPLTSATQVSPKNSGCWNAEIWSFTQVKLQTELSLSHSSYRIIDGFRQNIWDIALLVQLNK